MTEVVRIHSACSPLSAMAGAKAPPQGTGVCILACQVMFLLLSCAVEGGSRASRTRTRQIKFLPRKVCEFLLWLQLCICSYTEGHRKECVTEMVRVKSADSTLSAIAGVKLLPKVQVYVRSCSSMSSHVIMFLLLSCAVEGGSRASHTRTREVPLEEGVCICCGCSCAYLLFCMQQVTERSV